MTVRSALCRSWVVGLAVGLLMVALLGSAPVHAAPITYFVTIAADDTGASDCATSTNTDCSLHSAINASNGNAPGMSATNTINFAIGTGLQTIILAASLPDITAPVVIDGTSQSGFGGTPIIEVNGNGHGAAGGLILDATASGSTIKGLIIGGFAASGINIPAGSKNNTISGNYIGTDASGSAPLANGGNGVMIAAGATGNTIGGTTAAARNVISGNTVSGIDISDTTLVQGNYLGTNAAGTMPLGNQRDGITIDGGTGTIIGGAASGAGNVLSGNNFSGVAIVSTTTISNTVVAGNRIGTTADGMGPIPNRTFGVYIQPPQSATTIGGTATGAGNLISGNGLSGIYTSGPGGVTIQGNLIGTKADGVSALANGDNGILIQSSATNTTVGGTTAAERNVISGNAQFGILIKDSGTTGNTVAGNYIGTKADGITALANGNSGIGITAGTTGNTIGGTAVGAGNVISGNVQFGVLINGSGGNTVAGNFIGTDATGAATVRNGYDGVLIEVGASGNTIGGTAVGSRNVISGNGANANVEIAGTGANNNSVIGNYIGTNAAGDGKLTNGNDGILVNGGANNNTISGNLISGNLFDGVSIIGSSANTVQGNQIGVTVTGGPLGNGAYGVSVRSGSTNNTIGGTNAGDGNLIAFSGRQGVIITENPTTGNAIRGNSIHDNAALGIDLNNDGVTANGVNPRTFPNNGQNYPVLTTATFSNNTVTITGTLTSTASTTFHLDFYANTAADPTGYGEGQTYLGSQDVTTDGTGNLAAPFTATFSVAPGQHVITATATNATTNDTSEFAQDLPLPTLTIGNVSQNEGNSGTTPFAFAVTLSNVSGQPVTVNYATADGTATIADNDYQALNGTLTFAPGVTTQTITVLVNGDTKAEPDETFTVTLSSPTNATIATGTGTGTIVNDDGGLILTPTSLPNGTVGQPYSQQIVVSNGTAPYTFSLAGGTLPAGLTLGTDGKLAGTPTTANPFTFTVQAKDASGVTGSQQYTVTINAAPVIVLSPAALPAGMKGVAYSQTLAASGGAGPYTFTITAGTPPSGLTLDPTTGVFSGTPTAASAFTFTVQAKDANGFTGSQQYTITVSAAPLTSIALAAPSGAGNPPSIKVGQTEQFTATGTYADSSKQDVTTQVQWMSSNPNVATVDPTTGKVMGQSPGTVTITATLNGVTQTITVTVGAPTPIGITVAPAPAARPAGTTSQPGSAPAPAPAPRPAPATGASAQGVGPTGGSAPAPIPTGR